MTHFRRIASAMDCDPPPQEMAVMHPHITVFRLDNFDGNTTAMIAAIQKCVSTTDNNRILAVGISQSLLRWEMAVASGLVTDELLPTIPMDDSAREEWMRVQTQKWELREKVASGHIPVDDARIACIVSPVTAFVVLQQFSTRDAGFVDFYPRNVSFLSGPFGNICDEDQWQAACLWLLIKCAQLIYYASPENFCRIEQIATDLAGLYFSHPRYTTSGFGEDLTAEKTSMIHRIMIAAIVQSDTRRSNSEFSYDQIPEMIQKYMSSPAAVLLALNMARGTALEFSSIGSPGYFKIASMREAIVRT
jgi:hypothetical protein